MPSYVLEPASLVTLFTSTAAVANAARSVVSTVYDNAATGTFYRFGDMELTCNFSSAPTGSEITVFLLPALDGTNYADGSDSVIPSPQNIAGAFSVRLATGAQRVVSRGLSKAGFDLPACKFRLVLLNSSGQSLPSGWALRMMPFRDASA